MTIDLTTKRAWRFKRDQEAKAWRTARMAIKQGAQQGQEPLYASGTLLPSILVLLPILLYGVLVIASTQLMGCDIKVPGIAINKLR